MESVRYTEYLPNELTWDLFLRLGWRELYELYTGLDEYRDYDDPDLPLWEILYHRDLSSYPLPEGADYREQYFWGHALVDSLDWDSDELETNLLTLIRLGYDVPLRQLMIKTRNEDVNETKLVKAAVKGGYVTILKLLYSAFPNLGHSSMLEYVVEKRHLDVLNYYLDHIPTNKMRAVYEAMSVAADTGSVELYERLFEVVKANDEYRDINYCDFMNQAATSDKIELLVKMVELCQPDKTQLTKLIRQSNHISTLRFLVDLMVAEGYIEGLQDVDPNIILGITAADCDIDHLNYALSRGAQFRQFDYELLAQCDDPELHRWIVENLPESEYTYIMSHIIDYNPELGFLYLNSQTKQAMAVLMLESALIREDTALVKRIMEHPKTRMNDAKLEAFIQQHWDKGLR